MARHKASLFQMNDEYVDVEIVMINQMKKMWMRCIDYINLSTALFPLGKEEEIGAE